MKSESMRILLQNIPIAYELKYTRNTRRCTAVFILSFLREQLKGLVPCTSVLRLSILLHILFIERFLKFGVVHVVKYICYRLVVDVAAGWCSGLSTCS